MLGAIYLIFTTGHHAPPGRLDSRVNLADEALRLGRLLVELMPDDDECSGLLALLLATHARHRARLSTEGNLILLADQDRSLWDAAAVEEADALVKERFRRGADGPYLLQAAISCAHGTASTYEMTDWARIAGLYRLREAQQPTAVVRVNRAVAEAEAFGPEVGLELLEQSQGRSSGTCGGRRRRL